MTQLECHLPTIQRVVNVLRESDSLLFITGAGISADSGLPTYRGIGGLYDVDATDDGLAIEELLSGSTMRHDPELCWKYLLQLEQACRGAKFNRGHEVVAEMENHFKRVWTVTQNVDGFHHAAGSRHVIDLHGSLRDLKCTACSYRNHADDFASLSLPPQCPICGSIVRPDIVLFGECLPQHKLKVLYRELELGFDAVFTIGTASVFRYIAEPVLAAKRTQRATIEINPSATEMSHVVDIKLPLRASAALDAIWNHYQER